MKLGPDPVLLTSDDDREERHDERLVIVIKQADLLGTKIPKSIKYLVQIDGLDLELVPGNLLIFKDNTMALVSTISPKKRKSS